MIVDSIVSFEATLNRTGGQEPLKTFKLLWVVADIMIQGDGLDNTTTVAKREHADARRVYRQGAAFGAGTAGVAAIDPVTQPAQY